MAAERLFPPLRGPGPPFHKATCRCGAEGVVNCGGASTAWPDEAVMRKLRERGWTFKASGRKPVCPTCNGNGKAVHPVTGRESVPGVTCNGGCGEVFYLERKGAADTTDGMVPWSVVKPQLEAAGWLVRTGGGLGHKAALCPGCTEQVDGDEGLRAAMLLAVSAPDRLRDRIRESLRSFGQGRAVSPERVERAVAHMRARFIEEHGEPALAELERQERERMAAARTVEEDDMAQAAAQARDLTRDEKRAIMERLTEVYAGDGYTVDWSDAKVAETHKVPLVHVAAIRAEFFGDVATNETDARAARERTRLIHELRKDVDAAKRSQAGLLDSLGKADSAVAALDARLRKLEGGAS